MKFVVLKFTMVVIEGPVPYIKRLLTFDSLVSADSIEAARQKLGLAIWAGWKKVPGVKPLLWEVHGGRILTKLRQTNMIDAKPAEYAGWHNYMTGYVLQPDKSALQVKELIS